MIKYFLIIIFIQSTLFSDNLKQNSCDDYVFYELSLIKRKDVLNKTLISFDYEMSESLKTTILQGNFLVENEKQIIKQTLGKEEYSPCDELLTLVDEFNNMTFENNDYHTRMKFSKPVYITKNKVYLFMEVLVINKKEKRVNGGANLIQVIEKVNNQWRLEKKIPLEYY